MTMPNKIEYEKDISGVGHKWVRLDAEEREECEDVREALHGEKVGAVVEVGGMCYRKVRVTQ